MFLFVNMNWRLLEHNVFTLPCRQALVGLRFL